MPEGGGAGAAPPARPRPRSRLRSLAWAALSLPLRIGLALVGTALGLKGALLMLVAAAPVWAVCSLVLFSLTYSWNNVLSAICGTPWVDEDSPYYRCRPRPTPAGDEARRPMLITIPVFSESFGCTIEPTLREVREKLQAPS